MIFIEEDGQYIIVKCEECGTEHKIHRIKYKQYGDEYHFNPKIICQCGNTESIIKKDLKRDCIDQTGDIGAVKCPYCGSTQIQAFNKGFGLGKAVVGGALLGYAGLLGGFVGSKKVMVTCLKCGKRWEAGKY
ncbi:hypothetical protein [Clostridium aminobutyricum]|uniref:Uncharacterized protein n=1 Tax=Clostridium aminobutyricum TaxID=33953 RepID=A0A939D5R2_CLOAM|nr:hypothetical protein [Clostridium aminobutyricum]MBN7771834.1 hypothetical protein [Clostridium aminobutyricum]